MEGFPLWRNGLAASLECWDTGLISGLAQRVKDPLLPQRQRKSQLWLRTDPWSRNSIRLWAAKKKKKKKRFELLRTELAVAMLPIKSDTVYLNYGQDYNHRLAVLYP